MSKKQIIPTWKDEEYRFSSSEAERAKLPATPIGFVELSDADLEEVAVSKIGPAAMTASTAFSLILIFTIVLGAALLVSLPMSATAQVINPRAFTVRPAPINLPPVVIQPPTPTQTPILTPDVFELGGLAGTFVRIDASVSSTNITDDPLQIEDEFYFGVQATVGAPGAAGEQVSLMVNPPTDFQDDHYIVKANGRAINDILLWQGILPDQGDVLLLVGTAERDNALAPAILNALKVAAGIIIQLLSDRPVEDVFTDPGNLVNIGTGVAQFIDALDQTEDDVIGGLAIAVSNHGGVVSTKFLNPTMGSFSNQTPSSVVLNATGGGSSYRITLKVTTTPQTLQAAVSNKCLDVINGSLADGTHVQQFACHSGPNQRWKFDQHGTAVTPMPQGDAHEQYVFSIVSQKSAKCLDVENGSLNDGAKVIQSTCTGGPTQDWLVSFPDARGRSFIVNQNSGKCLDVPGFSLGDIAIQQFTCNGGPNQFWRTRD